MRYLHTMLRVANLEKSLHFYCEGLGFKIINREEHEGEKFTLVFLSAPGDVEKGRSAPLIELTHNWDVDSYVRGDAYGHMAYLVDSIEEIQNRLKKNGYDLSWGPGSTPSGKHRMAFIDDPDGYEIELLSY